MADIFRSTNRKREESAGLEKTEEKKKEQKPQMSQADFSGYSSRPGPSKKWVEKSKK